MIEGTSSEPPKHVCLIDGAGFIFRAYYALPPLTRPDGTPVNAVLGFVNMVNKLVGDTDADFLAVIFDAGRVSFRNDIYPDYKANRPEPPPDLIPQFSLIREATQAFSLPCIEHKGFEADDIIATYTRLALEAGTEVTIVSSDKDLMQLIEDRVSLYDGLKGRTFRADAVREKFGVDPESLGDLLALAGDSSDNVPGVPGIGSKTAAELLGRYGNLENLLEHSEEIKQPKRRQILMEHADDARLSRKLVQLRDDVPVSLGIADLARRSPNPDVLLGFLCEQGFRSVIAKLEGRILGAGEGVSEPVTVAYELVQDRGALTGWITQAEKQGIVAVDTETTSLDAVRARLVGVSLSLDEGRACYVPLAHTGSSGGGLDLEGDTPRQVDFDEALALLKPLFENTAVMKVGHNIKYDRQVLSSYGITVAPIDDTMLLSYVVAGGAHGHRMDELSRLHLGIDPIGYKQVAGTGKSQVTFDRVPLKEACDYAAEDADITGRLYRLLKPLLLNERLVTVYETLERPLVPILVDMERAGILVERSELVRLSRDFAGRLVALENEIFALAGHSFAIASPKQLGEVLFDEMGLEGGKKGKTGAYGTGADVLEGLALQGHELPARVLDWRQIAKLKSTYTDALVEQINPDTGRVHTSYAMAVASTGRLSSTDPNLQNIPVRTEEGRKIRRAFIAQPGHILLSADYSQIELRLLAHTARIGPLLKAFDAGEDIHALTASQVFGVPLEGMAPGVRRRAKAINFGIIYGISAFGLGRQLGIPQNQAASYIKAYFERYPGIRDYMENTKAFCRKHGYVRTIFGRRCYMPGINEKNPNRRGFFERAAINAPLQGSAADVIKRAMIRIPCALAVEGLCARMLLQVHDELLFEVPESEVDAAAKVVTRVMENAAQLAVPLVVDTGTGDNWRGISPVIPSGC